MIDAPVLLLVEDNEADIDLTVEILQDNGEPLTLNVAKDGMAALDALGSLAAHRDGPLPDLVLPDLNLPHKDGREVLAEIRDDTRLRHVPIVVLTSSDSPADILRSYQLGANSYVIKPNELTSYRATVEAIRSFWLNVAALPRGLSAGSGGGA
jgi:chemotaxis family two-component system response regulator Rcp1